MRPIACTRPWQGGVPVIVGDNPTMKKIVEQYHCGAVVAGDGSKVAPIMDGIEHFENAREAYRRAAMEVRNREVFCFNRSAWPEMDLILKNILLETI